MHGVTVQDCQRSIRRLSVEIEIIAEEIKGLMDKNASDEEMRQALYGLKEVISAKLNWEHRLALLMLERLLDEESARIN